MARCSTSVAIKEMQMRATMRAPHVQQKSCDPNTGGEAEAPAHSEAAPGLTQRHGHSGTQFGSFFFFFLSTSILIKGSSNHILGYLFYRNEK